MRTKLLAAAIVAVIVSAGGSFAQAPAPSPSPSGMDKAALSKSCSTQADSKGLHGKARKRFRSGCKRGRS